MVDEIDLSQLAHIVWCYRYSIVVLGLLGALIGVSASLMLTRYRAEALFLTPGLTLGNYRPYEAALENKQRLADFLERAGESDTEAGLVLTQLVEQPDGMQQAIKPSFAFTDKDAKEFGVKSADAAIVGMRLQVDTDEPLGAQPIRLLGEYVRDTKIRVDMRERMLGQCLKFTTDEQEIRNAEIADQFQVEHQQARADALREVIRRYPKAAEADNRQIVSLEKGGERYLSPVAQLVALELTISDLQLTERVRARQRVGVGLRKAYYCQAAQLLDEPLTGRTYLKRLSEIRTSIASNVEQNDVVEATTNALAIEWANWAGTYLQGMRFVAAPEGSETRVRKPGLVVAVVLGGMLGALFGVMLGFLRYWWRDNAAVVTAPD